MAEVLISYLKVHLEHVDHALTVFRDMQADVRANEDQTLDYAYYQSSDDETVFWVHEVFADEAAKQHHLGRHSQRRPDFDMILCEPPVFHAVHAI